MFGTLVVCLPSARMKGARRVLEHDGLGKNWIDFGGKDSEYQALMPVRSTPTAGMKSRR